VSSRTYLSIGDVLTLLREEFPDVTISKIRFLESQGLVNPERSPSGYRKFFDHDVERLRWVLRQQREHFLPLKVIRDRLADGELDENGAGSHAAEGGNGKPTRAANASRPAAASAGSSGAAAVAGTAVDEQPTKADEEAMARILADASRRAAQRPDAALASGAARPGLQVVDEAPARAPTVEAPRESEAVPVPVPVSSGAAMSAAARQIGSTGTAASGAGTPPSGAGSVSGASSAKRGEPTKPPAQPAPGQESNQASSGRAPSEAKGAMRAGRHGADAATDAGSGASAGAGAGAGAAATTAMVTGASMTSEEVCAASGLSAEELAGLEGFGLITSVNVAGIRTYDEDALTLANLAAQFRAYGIEARHLRLYRNAVDRELGLIEQVIIPLLRQRNPESRQRAVETSDQLASLGQSMRATLLHQALRQHLGG
jgi:DNA-binding transcriptional MerR regulator